MEVAIVTSDDQESAEHSDAPASSPVDDAPAGAEAVGEPIRASAVEKGLSIFILVLMAASLAYIVWVVILYWNDVGV